MAIFSGIIGGLLSGIGVFFFQHLRTINFRSSILYYDLKSMQQYFEETSTEISNIRYSKEWHETLAYCTFLESDVVKAIYYIYDSVYDYNERFGKGIKTKDNYHPYAEYKDAIFPTILKVIKVFEKEYPEFTENACPCCIKKIGLNIFRPWRKCGFD